MTEITFRDNRNHFSVTDEKLRIQIGGFRVLLLEEDIKDLCIFLNSAIVREHGIVKQLLESINGKTQP